MCPPLRQVAERIRVDPRVTVLERTNLRALRLADIGGQPVDLVSLDLSFISVLKVLEAVSERQGKLFLLSVGRVLFVQRVST
jgi:predicted rRNA methylase YqxC with S4 and FtsJ domains